MKVLLRFITRNVAGGVDTSERRIDAPEITIGRATDQILQLKDRRARLQHARIEAKGDGLHISTTVPAGVTVNGRSVRDSVLNSGDVIEVGANILRILDTPDDVDAALSFELSDDADREQVAASWATQSIGLWGLGKRKLSWLLVLVVVVVAFAIPALVLFGPATADFVRSNRMLPDDGLWLTGPLHAAHAQAGTDCQSCHVTPFKRVADVACVACHTVGGHVSTASLASSAGKLHAVIGNVRCASCHVEHNHSADLVNRNQALCGDCHTRPPVADELGRVGDFLDQHPDFRVSLLQPKADPDGSLHWLTQRLPIADARKAENSNLRFDHSAHLDPKGIVTPDGRRVLECNDCHTLEPGGARMQPITMANNCSGCHTLGFDPDAPSRVVPHGDVNAVVQTLVEYYSARLLGDQPDATEQRLRRPGKPLSREQRDRAAAEAREQAMSVAQDLILRRTCATCHEVTELNDGSAVPWKVLPVRLTSRYLPHAQFSHAQHGGDVAKCGDCHDAQHSESATDLLIPDISTCRTCHGSGNASRNTPGQMPSTCVLCHSFHRADKQPLANEEKD